jgi:hypothetical protein
MQLDQSFSHVMDKATKHHVRMHLANALMRDRKGTEPPNSFPSTSHMRPHALTWSAVRTNANAVNARLVTFKFNFANPDAVSVETLLPSTGIDTRQKLGRAPS